MRLICRGNNVRRLDLVARICALYKNPVLLLLLLLFFPESFRQRQI